MFLRLTEDARKAVLTRAAEEAHRRGDRHLGTVHLLLGLLHDPTCQSIKTLGVDLNTARAADGALDQAALAAIGINADHLDHDVGSGAPRKPPRLTSGARAVLRHAIELARPTRTGRITPRHFLLALLMCECPDPAAELLKALRVDVSSVRDRLSRVEATQMA